MDNLSFNNERDVEFGAVEADFLRFTKNGSADYEGWRKVIEIKIRRVVAGHRGDTLLLARCREFWKTIDKHSDSSYVSTSFKQAILDGLEDHSEELRERFEKKNGYFISRALSVRRTPGAIMLMPKDA